VRRRNQSHPLARHDDAVDNDRHGNKSKLRFIAVENQLYQTSFYLSHAYRDHDTKYPVWRTLSRHTNPGLEGGVGCNPRVTFDGKVRNLGPLTFCLCVSPQIDFPLPEDHLSVSLSLPVGNIPD
jgi:hypothetical protein